MLRDSRRTIGFVSTLALTWALASAATAQSTPPGAGVSTAAGAGPSITEETGRVAPPANRSGTPRLAENPQSSGSALEEVVVTALRRAASSQDVGASLDALSAERLDQMGVGDTQAIQFKSAGLFIQPTSNVQQQVYIRGVGNNVQGLSASNSVATYVDGVYIPLSVQAFQAFNDVERVEVLKGPQATLYGRNATGGAINIISKDPSFTPHFSADGMLGNYKAYSARLSINGPIVDDVLAGRFAIVSDEHEGYAYNPTLDNHPGGSQRISMRGALKWVATPDLDIILRGDFTYMRAGDYLKMPNGLSQYYTTSTKPNQYIADPWVSYADVNNYYPMEDKGVMLKAAWSSPFGKVTSLSSVRHFLYGPFFADYDGTDGGYNFGRNVSSFLGNKMTSNQVYHETYLSTPDENRLRAIIGATYAYEHSVDEERRASVTTSVGDARRIGQTNAWAVYGDVNYDLTDDLTLVGGLRYSKERKAFSQLVRVTIGGVAPGYKANHESWDALSPRIGLEWRPRKGLLYYATATSGFKSGGFNEADPLDSFDPEKIWSFEGGVKSTWMGGRLQANASAYYYDYTNLQVAIVIGSLNLRVVDNAKSAKMYGADFDVTFALTDDLTVGANLALLHSEYGDLIQCDDARGPCRAPPYDTGLVNVKGNQLQLAPAASGSVFLDYKFRPGIPGEFTFHTDGNYRSKVYFNTFEGNPNQTQEAAWLWNAQLRWDDPDRRYYTAVFVNNIFDKLYRPYLAGGNCLRAATAPFACTAGAPPNGSAKFDRYVPPRTYGVRIGYSF